MACGVMALQLRQSDLLRCYKPFAALPHLCDIPSLEHIQPQHKNDGVLKIFVTNLWLFDVIC